MSNPVCAIVGIGPKNGAAFAHRFDNAGYRIALLSRSTDYSGELASKLSDARAYQCDASDSASVNAALAQVEKQLGEVDVLIYNAGGGSWQTVEEISPEDFEQGWRVNALGALVASQRVIPAMKKKGSGNIIFVGATASLRGRPKTTGFASAKAAQRSLAQSMAKHLGPLGIHVSLLVIDGSIASAGSANAKRGEQLDPGDIAELAHYVTTQPRSAWSFEVDARPSNESW
ncbi:MAG: SDR family NAD(P)-dependent oxidoreductase [Betaproteobacteria bacterium]|nr:MAG: SDR family NAD(P)-dependent oxidoreductase [Betaproteobacteria bacterium]